MTVCAIAGGARITYGTNAPTTSNMRTRFSQSGDYTVLTDDKYTTMTDYLKAGDILVHENIHTVMVLENGSNSQSEPDDVESAKILQTYNVLSKVVKNDIASVTISIKTVKQLNEIETIVDTSDWSYILEYKKLPDGSMKAQNIINNQVTLNNLTEDTCYMYRIKVKNGNAELFCSAFKTFNTLKNVTSESNTQFNVNNNYVSATYIKTADGYNSVISYIE